MKIDSTGVMPIEDSFGRDKAVGLRTATKNMSPGLTCYPIVEHVVYTAARGQNIEGRVVHNHSGVVSGSANSADHSL